MKDFWPRPDELEPYHRITEILGCKWSLAIFDAIQRNINRPSQIEREYDGLTATQLHRCLNRLESDGILVKQVVTDSPPHTEYALTENGKQLVDVLASIRSLATNWPASH
ncbi:MAG: helix-turn-helix domain-containing protein [Fimbriimonadaceae bacterium]